MHSYQTSPILPFSPFPKRGLNTKHVRIRNQFADSGLTYIEYSYLIMYLIILLCTANSFFFAFGKFHYLKIIHYRNNLIPKLAYWPLIMGIMTIVTWLVL